MTMIRSLLGGSAAIAMTIALCGAAWAQSVVVSGNGSVDADTIRSYFLSGNAEEGARDLRASNLFSTVNAQKRGGVIYVTVVENNIINRVAFEGNSALKTAQIQPEMQLRSRGPFSREKADEDVERIREIYRRNGRGAAKVTYRTIALSNGRTDVVYTIKEGGKTGIKEINFVGNEIYSSRKLRGLMQSSEMNFMSWFKSTDIYDPERITADEEIIRRYYLRNGYADFRIDKTDVRYDEEQQGYIITIAVSEGPQYRVGEVIVDSKLAAIDGKNVAKLLRLEPGDVYDGVAVEKSLEDVTRDVARKGYAFAQVRPRGERNEAERKINLALVVDEGPRVYVERIVVRGNTRTRDYVIRREFDIGEGDPYNRVLVETAERRLNNLGYFKKVKITNEPGSSADRVIINVDVEDQPTGAFSVSGGYSTTDGFVAELSMTETNFLGRGQYLRAAVSNGQRSKGFDLSWTEPYLLDHRIAMGFDFFSKKTDNSEYSRYEHHTTGGTLRFGVPLTDEITLAPRYSLYTTRIKIPNTASDPYDDCTNPINGVTPGFGVLANLPPNAAYNCLMNGEASLVVKESRGSWLTSMAGYSLIYNTLDNVKSPTKGYYAELRQDFAGIGGDSKFVRTTGEVRAYREFFDEVVGFVRLQGGHLSAWGGRDVRLVDNFNLGPSLVRGFASNGLGPRDISDYADTRSNPLGGTKYYGGTAEVQFPFFGVPKEIGLKGALFVDAGSLFGYDGRRNFNSLLGLPPDTPCTPTGAPPRYTQGNCALVHDSHKVRASVGASVLWASPMGPIRFDWAYPFSKDKYDVKQYFRFSGGTSF